jgi:hypothetical protein
MPPFMYRCPIMGYRVQSFSAEKSLLRADMIFGNDGSRRDCDDQLVWEKW